MEAEEEGQPEGENEVEKVVNIEEGGEAVEEGEPLERDAIEGGNEGENQ